MDIGTLAIKESVAAPGVAVHLMGMKTVEEVSALSCLKLRCQLSRPIFLMLLTAMPADGILTVAEVSSLQSIGNLGDVQCY